MTTPSETELAQRLEVAERKLDAVNDLLVLMAAHMAQLDPKRGEALSAQMRELYEMDNVAWPEEFQTLVARLGRAFDGSGLELESLP
ncbi:hypothetical protein ASF84_10945 [Pseudomonas sp. Leaf127]|uniref:hypothetical protein n=1 Tax=Pseudomonas TaxID=286 RepID=UPI000702567D|nr:MULTISPECIES: hypothetical protein [Pseudomonas]KQQ55839.1 hypothetical protein ASF84_10945 [Pseudomonas sp. Leaf127]